METQHRADVFTEVGAGHRSLSMQNAQFVVLPEVRYLRDWQGARGKVSGRHSSLLAMLLLTVAGTRVPDEQRGARKRDAIRDRCEEYPDSRMAGISHLDLACCLRNRTLLLVLPLEWGILNDTGFG